MKISVSQLKLFKACRRAWYLKYVEGLEPVKKPDALEVGINYHSGIEGLYKGEDYTYHEPGYTKEEAMVEAYKKYIMPNVKIVATEEWYEKPITPNDILIGRIDGVADDGCVVEHKTTSMDIGPEYEFNLQWDEQILAYMFLTDTRKIHYTVCKKPTIRQKKNETDEEFYQRMVAWYDDDTESKIKTFDIIRTDAEVAAWIEELIQTVKHMNGEVCYRNCMHCMSFGRKCEYQSVCLYYDPEQEYVDYIRR